MSYTEGTDTITQWSEITENSVLNEALAKSLVLQHIPGSGIAYENLPGVKRISYNMTSTVDASAVLGAGFSAVPAYRLKPNPYKTYSVYQFVRNDDNDYFYIKLDDVLPPLLKHDFYRTLRAYSDFGDFEAIDFYYDKHLHS